MTTPSTFPFAVPLADFTMDPFSDATSLPDLPDDATSVLVTIDGSPVRVTFAGAADPTPSTGVKWPIGTTWYAGTLKNVRMIPESGTATVSGCAFR